MSARPGSVGSPGATALVVALLAAGLLAAACGRDTGTEGGGTVLVFAAASLTDVMAEAEPAFEAANPGVDVTVSLGGSASLLTQILEGAPADVVATANPAIMASLAEAGALADRPSTLATNRLVIAVAPGNPAGVDDIGDLADPDLFVGLCAAEVPCGDLADRSLAEAGVVVESDTREPDVRSLLAKIEAGELDAGLVYATDVLASTAAITGIDLPRDLPTTTEYPIAVLDRTTSAAGAEAFVAFLGGPDGRRILRDHGFETR